jgi:hypothetical protein
VRTGGLGVSMRFMGPEEGGVVAVSRTPGPSIIGIFAAGPSLSNAASSSEGGGEGAKGKGGYSGTKGGEVSSGSPANIGFSSFLHFSLHLEAAATLATMILHAFSRWGFSHVGRLRTTSRQGSK